MTFYIKPFVVHTEINYRYLTQLQRTYATPYDLLCTPAISLERKKYLLKKWRDERASYIFEHCRDHDYLHDIEMEKVLKILEIAQIALDTEEKINVKIHIYYVDPSA